MQSEDNQKPGEQAPDVEINQMKLQQLLSEMEANQNGFAFLWDRNL
jgi:hypothetical protein